MTRRRNDNYRQTQEAAVFYASFLEARRKNNTEETDEPIEPSRGRNRWDNYRPNERQRSPPRRRGWYPPEGRNRSRSPQRDNYRPNTQSTQRNRSRHRSPPRQRRPSPAPVTRPAETPAQISAQLEAIRIRRRLEEERAAKEEARLKALLNKKAPPVPTKPAKLAATRTNKDTNPTPTTESQTKNNPPPTTTPKPAETDLDGDIRLVDAQSAAPQHSPDDDYLVSFRLE